MCQNNGTLGALSDSWLMNVYSPNYGNFIGFDPSENFSVESCTGAAALRTLRRLRFKSCSSFSTSGTRPSTSSLSPTKMGIGINLWLVVQ